MTTKLPRIAFVPSEQVHELLRELSTLSGQSLASLVSEMMDEIVPVFQGQISAIRQIAASPEKAREYVHDYATKAMADISQTVIEYAPTHDPRSVEGKKEKRRAARAALRP
jgi:SET domain-containing protein